MQQQDGLRGVVDPDPIERLATGFSFTEGPLWDPDAGALYFVDLRQNRLHRIVPGREAEIVREDTGGGNGTTFDLDGGVLMCEGGNRRVSRMDATGRMEVLADRFEGKRLNRPNDVVCRSDGTIYFTDPGLRMPIEEREQIYSAVYRVGLDRNVSLVATCEFPNGLAFSPDERTLYVSNTRSTSYIHALEIDANGDAQRRRIFADLSADEEGVPDGMKVDAAGRVFCTGPGGTWVIEPDGTVLGVIRTPELPANVAFGGPDLRTLFLTARTSVYSVRLSTPGLAHPRFRA